MNPSRIPELQSRLQQLFADLAGTDAATLDPRQGFLELGLDSLLLTQASQAIGRSFGTRVPMRVLLEDCPTIDALARHLDAILPPPAAAPQAAPQAAPPALASPVAAPAPAISTEGLALSAPPPAPTEPSAAGPGLAGQGGHPVVAEVIAQQLSLMSRQLDMLRGLGQVMPPVPALPGDQTVVPAAAPAVAVAGVPTASSPVSAGSAAPAAFGPYRPPVRQASTGLTAEQSAALSRFVERYNRRTPGSKRATEQHRAHLADPRSVAGFRLAWKELVYPIVTVRSTGAHLWDVDGNDYIDITNGFGMILFGHNPDFVRSAVERQLESGYEIGPQTPLAGEVAGLVCEMVGMERAAFCGSGSEAVTAAIRVARTVTGRDKIVMFAGAYHGIFDEVLARPARGADAVARALPIAPGIPAAMTQNIVVLEYGSDEALRTIRELGPQLAAVLVEPVQSRRPDLQPRAFLQELRTITEASGTALVFDEVVTGFRVHPGGAQALFGIRADIATYGKVVGGGLPIGIVAGSARFMDALDGGAWRYGDDSVPEAGVTFFAGTFVRHPLALAAARAVLQRLKDEGPELQRGLNLRTAGFVERLRGVAARAGAPLSVTHFASWFCFQLPGDWPLAPLFYAAMRLRGIHVWEGRPCFLTLAHSDDDLDRVAQAVQASLVEMQQAGFLPPGADQPPSPAPAQLPPPAAPQPPMPGARLGRDAQGNPAWFVADPDRPGKYLQIKSNGAAHG